VNLENKFVILWERYYRTTILPIQRHEIECELLEKEREFSVLIYNQRDREEY